MGLLIREHKVDHQLMWPVLPCTKGYPPRPIPGISTPTVGLPVVGPMFREAAEQYYREVIEAPRTPLSAKNTKSLLNYHLLPAWAEKPLAEIKKGDIRALFRRIGTTRTRPYRGRLDGCQNRANTAYWFLRQFFFWATDDEAGEDLIRCNPMFGLKQPYPRYDRERFLSDDELRWFWAATAEMGYPFGTIARLLLLTGQRRGEIANMTRNQIDRAGQMLTIPIRSTKSRRGHLVPLSDLAMEVLNEVPSLPGRVAVFGPDGIKPPDSAHFYKANHRLNDRMREICRAEAVAAGGDIEDANVEYLTYHDLRRTAATVMCRIGQPLEVVDKIMNHAGGRTGTGRTVNACTRIYCRFEFMDERRVALHALADHVTKLVGL